MERSDIIIRIATPDDAAEILKIYAPYVEKTAISFEYEVPGIAEFKGRIKETLKKYPYIVAIENGQIAGYAYTGVFSGRTAYNHSVATTIYVDENKKKTGLGRMLYKALEDISKAQNIINMNACIGYPSDDAYDGHLNKNSPQFHEHMGYSLVGEFHKCGYKFGRWYNMVWMEKMLGEHVAKPQPFIPFPELSTDVLERLGVYRACNKDVQCIASSKTSMGAANKNDFLDNIDKIHTTEQGAVRIAKNLELTTEDIVAWCKEKVASPEATITREGKNWYVRVGGVVLTINACSYTIITAHKTR